jgi:uncharacterized protein (TIGR02147 family)
MIFEHSNYRSYLKEVLAERIRKNPSYTVSGFARHLALSHTAVAQVFKGRKNLSVQTALRIAKTLALAPRETEYFCLLVQSDSVKDPELKDHLLTRLQVFSSGPRPRDLTVDQFKCIADWHHLATLALTDVNPILTPAYVADKLGITALEAELAIDRLLRLELLIKEDGGRFRKADRHVVVKSKQSNAALKKFNKQMLGKAVASLDSQSSLERWGGSETFAISQQQLPECRALMDEFLRQLAEISAGKTEKTDVYHVNIQLFNLTHSHSQTRRGVRNV